MYKSCTGTRIFPRSLIKGSELQLNIIKKNGLIECFAEDKIINAIKKSSERIAIVLDDVSIKGVVDYVKSDCGGLESIKVVDLHGVVERALDSVNRDVAKSYKDYRNYKKEFGLYLMDDIEEQVKKTLHEVDRENSNSNTRYISTKRTEIAQTFSKEMYQKMYLSKSVLAAMKDGYIYVHDLKDMLLPQFNCCLSDIGNILKGGFEMEGVYYNEPKDIRTAVGQLGDVVMVISAQHFGGHTVPEIDKVLSPYYKRTISKYENKYKNMGVIEFERFAREEAYNDLKQSMQGLEVMLNTVVSARGSYPSM